MKLYKYASPELWDKILKVKQIRFTQPGIFNDPFEMQPFYESFAEDPEIQKNLNETEYKNALEILFAEQYPSLLERFPRWIPRERWLNKYDPDEESKLFAELDGRLQTVCRLLLNTGLRPPKEILLAEKQHVNLSDKSVSYRFSERDGAHLAGRVILPPRSLLVAHGKDRTTRVVPLNDAALALLEVLCRDAATGPYLFANRDGSPLLSFKKGFAAACSRAGIEGLRPYDLRHTFATRLQERYVHAYTISELLGHAQPAQGFGQASRVTPNYSHATWEAMRRAVESLAYEPSEIVVFGAGSGKSREKSAGNGAEEAPAKAG